MPPTEREQQSAAEQQVSELIGRINQANNEQARLQTLLRGWLKGANNAMAGGTSEFRTWSQTQTGQIDNYCTAVLGPGQTYGAGGTGNAA